MHSLAKLEPGGEDNDLSLEEFCWEKIVLENDYEDDDLEEENNVDDDKNGDDGKNVDDEKNVEDDKNVDDDQNVDEYKDEPEKILNDEYDDSPEDFDETIILIWKQGSKWVLYSLTKSLCRSP